MKEHIWLSINSFWSTLYYTQSSLHWLPIETECTGHTSCQQAFSVSSCLCLWWTFFLLSTILSVLLKAAILCFFLAQLSNGNPTAHAVQEERRILPGAFSHVSKITDSIITDILYVLGILNSPTSGKLWDGSHRDHADASCRRQWWCFKSSFKKTNRGLSLLFFSLFCYQG